MIDNHVEKDTMGFARVQAVASTDVAPSPASTHIFDNPIARNEVYAKIPILT